MSAPPDPGSTTRGSRETLDPLPAQTPSAHGASPWTGTPNLGLLFSGLTPAPRNSPSPRLHVLPTHWLPPCPCTLTRLRAGPGLGWGRSQPLMRYCRPSALHAAHCLLSLPLGVSHGRAESGIVAEQEACGVLHPPQRAASAPVAAPRGPPPAAAQTPVSTTGLCCPLLREEVRTVPPITAWAPGSLRVGTRPEAEPWC